MFSLLLIISFQAGEIAEKLKLSASDLAVTAGMAISLAEFTGPDGRTADSILCDAFQTLGDNCVVFLEYSDRSTSKFRIVVLDRSGTPVSHSCLFPSTTGRFTIETAGVVNVFTDKKGVYLKMTQQSETVSRTYDLIFLLEETIAPLFYNLLSKEQYRDGGRDMKSLLYLSGGCLCLAQSPEYWVKIDETEAFYGIERSVWSIPGTIYFEPDFYGYSPKSYIVRHDSFALHGKDLIFLFDLPSDERFFPTTSWIGISDQDISRFLNIWSAFLGYNFAVSSSSYTGFDPSFKIVGGSTEDYLELIIYLQDSEISHGKDLFSMYFSNPSLPDYNCEISLFPHDQSNTEQLILKLSNFQESSHVKARSVSQSENTIIFLVEIPVSDLKDALNLEGKLNIVSAFLKYRDVDGETVSFVSLPSNADPSRRETWADIIFGELTLK
ncbi:hypothetical protein JXL83_01520 [candidate division WOR-3 bacterium]|nr:hypothetical protein [candidate division WOR-3 bacterium]